jgi:hypothetical protein
MVDVSLVDGEPGAFDLQQSLERSAGATDNSHYVYFIGDLASHLAEGYHAMVIAKVGLSEWNGLLDVLLSGDVDLILARAASAETQLQKVSVAPTKTASAFGQLWATCPGKLAHVLELIAVLNCLHKGGEFPIKVRDNPLFNASHALKALASAMFNLSKEMALTQLQGADGDLAKYATQVYHAASWARFAALDVANQNWLKINVGAVNRQTTGVDAHAIDATIRQQVRSC